MLKSLIKNNRTLLSITASIYNFIHFNNSWIYRFSNTFSLKGAFLKKTKFYISGNRNTVSIGRKARLKNCTFTFIGNNCKVEIGGDHTIISNVHFWCQDDNSSIIIGEDFTMEGGHIAATEGKSIIIGDDCMFSGDVEIRNGDSHSIINSQTGRRINHSEDVNIGNHVWLTAHVRVLKGSTIPSNSIIGNSSVVSGKFNQKNALYIGIPCKIIKENIDWNRYKL